MTLFNITGEKLDRGYINIGRAESRTEAALKSHIDELWQAYQPYADPDFAQGFARDIDARFWEMFLGCLFLEAGFALLPVSERKKTGGQPDLCVLDGPRRIWIEAIAPDTGKAGPDQVVGPVPINRGGRLMPAPIRQAQLRASHALWVKAQKLTGYLAEGVIGADDIRIVAISAARFGSYVSEDPLPLIMTSVFPIGEQFVTIDTASGAVVDEGHHPSFTISKQTGEIPRTAFLDGQFEHVSGVIWSRIGIGNLSRAARPVTYVHNPLAVKPLAHGSGIWDKEFVTVADGEAWMTSDILARIEPPGAV